MGDLKELEFCTTEADGRILTVTINRPERMNALHWKANAELASVFDRAFQGKYKHVHLNWTYPETEPNGGPSRIRTGDLRFKGNHVDRTPSRGSN